MYKMTPRMVQRFYADLERYHNLFDGGRCSGWEQEELIVKAIKSDTTAQHNVKWTEGGHDDKADITVQPNGKPFMIQIKSGEIKSNYLVLSGHRLGRFNGDFARITKYLNNNTANVISIPYEKQDDDKGRKHIYKIAYVDVKLLTGLSADGWDAKGKTHEQNNSKGVVFSLRPTMSWQIWWKIPIDHVIFEPHMSIG